jgi:hypothetical protein
MAVKKTIRKVKPVTNPNLKKAGGIGLKNPKKLTPKQDQELAGGIVERSMPKKA